jgi:lipopolysaccharide transport system ATP-binding protein
MSVIQVENLAKRYLIGHQSETHDTFRDALSSGLRSLGRKLAHPFLSSAGQPFAASSEEFWALRDVSFEVKQGERVGIIGRNGAGKSTLLKILSRITEPTEGKVRIRGRVASLLEVGTGFHPELTGRENIFLNGAILGMGKAEIRRKFDEIVAFAEVEKFLDTPVKRYSSGMYVRLAFAVAAHLEPEILIVDEVLAVGDAQFQQKCLGKMEEVGREGRTVLFVSHNMGAIKNLCTRGLLLKDGIKLFEGEAGSTIDKYLEWGGNNNDSITWEPKKSPRVPSARLIEVGILSGGKSVGTDLSTEKPIQIFVRFAVEKEANIGTTVLLSNSEGQLLFASLSNHEKEWHGKKRPVGIYRSDCEIPGNLLASGQYLVSIGFWEGFYQHGVVEKDVIRFHAFEEGMVRGDLPYESKGIFRPLLKWHSHPE